MDDNSRNELKKLDTFITIGYYICKVSDTSFYLNNLSTHIISASECLCRHEPQITLCAGWKPNGDNEEYRQKCGLSTDEYYRMSEEITNLFTDNFFHFDGRFIFKKDAVSFYSKYFCHPEYMIISVKAERKYIEEIERISSDFETGNESFDIQEFLGYDIIGWDIDRFHSFLCNRLQDEFDCIKFTDLCLLDADYERVAEMAELIQGKGEPVDWFPCRIDRVQIM